MVTTIQWLRGAAALMVVIHHARNPQPWLFNPLQEFDAFAWGVDIFFAISGFIMYVATRSEPPLAFLRRRIVRVVPLYWLATIFLLIISKRFALSKLSLDEVNHVAMSLFFIPHYSSSNPGNIWPYLIPGWTLNYEMFFYFIFSLALFFKRPLAFTTTVMITLVGLGIFFDYSGQAALLTFTNLQLLEFVAGMWVGHIFSKGKLGTPLFVLLPLGFFGLFVTPFVAQGGLEVWLRILYSTSILVGAVSISGIAPKIDLMKKLGDASYSIYLSHAILGLPIAVRLTKPIPISGWMQFSVFIFLSIVVSSTIGYRYAYIYRKTIIEDCKNAESRN